MSARRFDRLLLDFRLHDQGGPVLPGRLRRSAPPYGWLSDQETAAMRGDTMGRKVLFLVHGFNVSRGAGIVSLEGLMGLLAPAMPETLLVGCLWPGDSGVGAFSYPFEGPDADDTAARLAARIGDWIHPSAELAFVAHSKGCRVVLRTIDKLAQAKAPQRIAQACLMAGAVDRDCLAGPAAGSFVRATLACGRTVALSSVKDRVLMLAYPAGDLLQGWFYAETDEPGLALGYKGPTFPKDHDEQARLRVYHEAIPPAANIGHGDYLPHAVPPAAEAQRCASFSIAALTGRAEPRFA
jgi:hypothetical protein